MLLAEDIPQKCVSAYNRSIWQDLDTFVSPKAKLLVFHFYHANGGLTGTVAGLLSTLRWSGLQGIRRSTTTSVGIEEPTVSASLLRSQLKHLMR